jgi:hypothetical protein
MNIDTANDTQTTIPAPAVCFFRQLTGNPRPDCSCGRTTAEESSCLDC